MAAPPSSTHPPAQQDDLLKRPLYAFDLPENLLSSLVVKGSGQDVASISDVGSDTASTVDTESRDPLKETDPSTGMSCTLCGVKSNTIQEQRSHVRSDVHLFNIKRKIRNQPPVSEIEFEKMMEELDESLSGSESSEEEDETSASDPLSTLLRKKAVLNATEGDLDNAPRKHRSPIIWLSTPLLPAPTTLGIYRAILPGLEEESEVPELLLSSQTRPTAALPTADSPHIFLCMLGGGHFAGMIVSLVPKVTKRSGVIEREAVVLAHKTFHRYTTRRKQGGSQALNDAKGGAQSAGASLRRYNEMALTQEVRDLLASWKPMLDSSSLLFIRAAGTNNRRTLFSYDNAVLKANDSRVRGFPFSTRRATQSELMRCFLELTRLKVSQVDPTIPTATPPTSTSPSPSTTKPSKSKPSKEQTQATQHTTLLTTLLRRSKAPAIVAYLNSNKLPFTFHLHPENYHTPTLLHLAASQSQPTIVLSLLTKSPNDNAEPADPTIRNSSGKTPYEVSGDRATREIFRVARHDLGEEKFNWEAAGVPSPISRQEYDEAVEKERLEKVEKDAEEKSRREKETARLKSLPEASSSAGGGKPGRRLAEVIGAPAVSAREEESKGLSEQAKMRLERERRARAAEERMKRLAGK